ncbi:hypothetical protein UlMin_010809 [Ulmus minor]
MVRNSSNRSPSSTKPSKSKSKSKQPQKSSNPSSSFPASKQPQSSSKPVSSQGRNHQVKPHYLWIRKDSSKPSSSYSNQPPTINPTQFPAPSNIPNQQTKGKNLFVEEGSSYLITPLSPPASSSSNGPLSPSGLLPSYPKLRPKLREIQSSEPDENEEQQKNYGLIEKDSLPIYRIPKRIRVLIEKDIVPKVLHKPLSSSSYRDYFAALLYAEEFYLVKWRDFEMRGVKMQLQKASVYTRRRKKDDKLFVVFEIDSIPEKRPYLLSRDIVYARPSGRNVEPFEGILHKVAKSIHVLVDFDNDFHFQHHASRIYDISFSFNRICLKRAHHALQAASNPMLRSLYLFPASLSGKAILTKLSLPSENNILEPEQLSAVDEILSLEGPSPYLLEGQLCVSNANRSSSKPRKLSRTGEIVRESVIRIYQRSPRLRILICSPFNGTCDELMMRLQEVIPEYNMFRANAAFRELEAVPSDILPSCPYDGECFTCPSLDFLNRFRVIFSTFVTCFRLHREGIASGHFSHIFLVDTSAATEPETMIALANFADENTTVVITGSPTNSPNQVRSDIARRKGLNISYFERLRKESSGD